ncbi:amino acid/polyamine transporter I [Mariannaea sp. PMI_226]|nr:amino acid/polyamine transporter I [Mariannaea sp. PMI_226]
MHEHGHDFAAGTISANGHDGSADQTLEKLGYKPELSRNRSTFQVAFMSFVLASIPYGLATTLYYPLIGGGPVNIIWGWVAVSGIIACVAASLGEITSVYPTAGGVYYQTFMLAPPKWRRIASWICGWLFLVGNITITLAVNFGTALFVVAAVDVFEKEPGVGVLAGEPYQVFLIFLGLTLICNAVSAFGNSWLPWLDMGAIIWTFAAVIAILATVLAMAKDGLHTGAYVFGHFEAHSGWPDGWSFCVGLLQAGYATSSTGMILSMCEEVREPATQVPKAMLVTILLNTLAGLAFLIPVVFVLPNIPDLLTIASGQPVPAILKSAVGSAGGAFGLLFPLIILAIMCGIGCTTAASRCTWAFARDGAIPGSGWLTKVNKKLEVPLNAMILSMIVQIILGLVYFGSSAAFNAFSGVGVICLTASYACPIAINLATGRKQVQGCQFPLGAFGYLCNVVAIAWSLLAMPLFCMPSYIPVEASTVNYASVVFVAATLASALWYWAWGHKNYVGPPTQAE